MNIKAVSTVQADSADQHVWKEVLESVSPEHRFLSQHWYDVWSRAYAANDEDMQPVVYSSTVAIEEPSNKKDSLFPCVIRRRLGLEVLSMAGYYYPFRTFLCPSDIRADALSQFAAMVHAETKATIVHIGPMQVSDQINVPLQAAFDQQKWRIFEVSAGAQQVVNMPATVEDFRASLSRNLRKNHDRRRRSLEAMGQFEISYYNDCAADVWDTVIDSCAEVEGKSWLALNDDGKTRVYGRESFWKSYAANDDGSAHLSVWVVSIDAKPIAYSLAIDSGSCRYSISGQYDEEYKKHGVGIIADMSMFEQAIASGKTVVNMGDGESDYKRRWGAEPSAELLSLYIFRPSVIGKLGHTALHILDRMRRSKLFYRLNRYF